MFLEKQSRKSASDRMMDLNEKLAGANGALLKQTERTLSSFTDKEFIPTYLRNIIGFNDRHSAIESIRTIREFLRVDGNGGGERMAFYLSSVSRESPTEVGYTAKLHRGHLAQSELAKSIINLIENGDRKSRRDVALEASKFVMKPRGTGNVYQLSYLLESDAVIENVLLFRKSAAITFVYQGIGRAALYTSSHNAVDKVAEVTGLYVLGTSGRSAEWVVAQLARDAMMGGADAVLASAELLGSMAGKIKDTVISENPDVTKWSTICISEAALASYGEGSRLEKAIREISEIRSKTGKEQELKELRRKAADL